MKLSADSNSTFQPIVQSKKLSVSFVVPAHNEQRHIEQCLRSIASQEAARPDVLTSLTVVDNQSTDDTTKIATRLGARVIDVTPGNPGRARNAGAAGADADFIVFVDADCVLPPRWLDQCLQHFDDNSVVAVGASQAAADPDAPWVERVWVDAIVPPSCIDWERAEWLPAFNIIVRKAVFDQVGRFDESLRTCEDSDLSFRLAKQGELRRDFRVPVQHLGESRTLAEFFQREMWRSRGNFRSALKRRALMAELPSLFLPIGYLVLLVLALVSLVGAIAQGGTWWWVFAGTSVLLIVTPLAIAFRKVGSRKIASTATLLAVYLAARGLGPMLPARRVSRD